MARVVLLRMHKAGLSLGWTQWLNVFTASRAASRSQARGMGVLDRFVRRKSHGIIASAWDTWTDVVEHARASPLWYARGVANLKRTFMRRDLKRVASLWRKWAVATSRGLDQSRALRVASKVIGRWSRANMTRALRQWILKLRAKSGTVKSFGTFEKTDGASSFGRLAVRERCCKSI